MKRVNIACGFLYEFDDLFRPSKRATISKSLSEAHLYNIKDICMLSEKDFRKLDFITDYMFGKIKDRLTKAGLHFGMTESELDDYMDAEYLEDHQEDIEEQKAAEEKAAEEKVQEAEEKATAAVNEEEELLGKIKSAIALGINDGLRDLLLEQQVQKTMQEVYLHQSWWKKLFSSKTKRSVDAWCVTWRLLSGTEYLVEAIKKLNKTIAEDLHKQNSNQQ